jgi:hypothetical protein
MGRDLGTVSAGIWGAQTFEADISPWASLERGASTCRVRVAFGTSRLALA